MPAESKEFWQGSVELHVLEHLCFSACVSTVQRPSCSEMVTSSSSDWLGLLVARLT